MYLTSKIVFVMLGKQLYKQIEAFKTIIPRSERLLAKIVEQLVCYLLLHGGTVTIR